MGGRRFIPLLAITLGVLSALPASCLAAFPGQFGGQIAFSANRGTSEEIWVMSSAGFGQTALTANTAADTHPAWSPSGNHLAFASNRDGNYEIYMMQPDGSGQTRLTTEPADQTHPAWSADGTRIAFAGPGGVYTMDADGSDQALLIPGATEPAWAPDGLRIAFVRDGDIWVANADATGEVNLTPADFETGFIGLNQNPNWSPSGGLIAFAHDGCEDECGFLTNWEIWTVQADGSNLSRLTGGENDYEPAWSPDGSRLSLTTTGPCDIVNCGPADIATLLLTTGTRDNLTDDQGGTNPDWQPRPFTGHVRPRSAGPLQVALVPAYTQCAAPNRTHAPPLAFPSCNPPGQTSSYLTVGTPDANGAPANSVGSARFKVRPGAPGPPHDTQAFLTLSLTDVRCAAAAQPCGSANAQGGADYTGELEGRVTLRISDRWSSVSPGGGSDPATMTDYTLRLPMFAGCTSTASTTIGASCNATINMAAVIPGVVPEGRRAVWEMEQVRIYDGGPDGDAATDDNTLFATQGIFVP